MGRLGDSIDKMNIARYGTTSPGMFDEPLAEAKTKDLERREAEVRKLKHSMECEKIENYEAVKRRELELAKRSVVAGIAATGKARGARDDFMDAATSMLGGMDGSLLEETIKQFAILRNKADVSADRNNTAAKAIEPERPESWGQW